MERSVNSALSPLHPGWNNLSLMVHILRGSVSIHYTCCEDWGTVGATVVRISKTRKEETIRSKS
jgi:hypothetical protein